MFSRYAPPGRSYQPVKRPPSTGGGLSGQKGFALPFGMDAGDLLLLLVLLLVWLDSRDEEFLIILAVMAFSILRGHSS